MAGVPTGKPSAEARRPASTWLIITCLTLLALFGLDALASRMLSLSALDLPLERVAQTTNWGPLSAFMDLTNWSGGWPQALLGTAAAGGLLAWRWASGLRLMLASAASGWDSLLKVALHRPRPSPELVHVGQVNAGFSFPSGHAVFFTWLAVMLAAALAAGRGRTVQALIWSGAIAVPLLAALGRVWAGAHWPTDVAGGILFALAWCCLVHAVRLPPFLLRPPRH